ncbi:hypothetical protein MAPG_07212 [Magnaporthiopsis poae ATCC 64411]|uniref:Uncharacterized protein n=1 Tax=Magnaporthiopsis poae (strain ATCC 64411 / 73-15) TaxID=644358 RepID=A0A0C4E424_MAGP6|nr:hypothetical protein MAPG_07212 [Magnaporthiopsis poae ATCC 64411]
MVDVLMTVTVRPCQKLATSPPWVAPAPLDSRYVVAVASMPRILPFSGPGVGRNTGSGCSGRLTTGPCCPSAVPLSRPRLRARVEVTRNCGSIVGLRQEGDDVTE